MDGVIVDTRDKLYGLYIRFLKSFGKEATLEECRELDGLKLAEIITYAKQKHNLKDSEEELINRYNREIKKVYSQVALIKDVKRILQKVKKHGGIIALASSAKRKNIDQNLERFHLEKYFDFIVSGDDVSQAKPSPEIYNRVRNHFGDKEYYVIEDSSHGIAAATSAKMSVIFLNDNKQKENKLAEYTIKEMNEMNEILKEIERECKTVALADKVEVHFQEHNWSISDRDQEIVESHWELQKEQNSSLFNGTILSYYAHHFEGDTLHIDCSFAEYKYYLAQLAGKVSMGIKPLAVSGLIIDKDNNTFLARRSSKVTEYKEYYEFVPSGGLSKEDIKERKVFFKERLAMELEEETTLSSDDIIEIDPLGLILDRKDNVFDICMRVSLKGSLNQRQNQASLIRSNEYLQPKIISMGEVDRFFQQRKIVPTSLSLYAAIKRTDHNYRGNTP